MGIAQSTPDCRPLHERAEEYISLLEEMRAAHDQRPPAALTTTLPPHRSSFPFAAVPALLSSNLLPFLILEFESVFWTFLWEAIWHPNGSLRGRGSRDWQTMFNFFPCLRRYDCKSAAEVKMRVIKAAPERYKMLSKICPNLGEVCRAILSPFWVKLIGFWYEIINNDGVVEGWDGTSKALSCEAVTTCLEAVRLELELEKTRPPNLHEEWAKLGMPLSGCAWNSGGFQIVSMGA